MNSKIIIFFFIYLIIYPYANQLLKYKIYIKRCKQKEFIKQPINIIPENIFLSIGLPTYNMEKYIESSLLSIINQSFQNFEIIVVNDNSNDNTQNIIKILQNKDKRIKYINHSNNLGVYASRANAILNAEGKYILLMDPDDILLNQDIFKKLYDYNKKYNLDIIEFLVYHQKEGKNNIIFPKEQELNHYHHFRNKIIKQPELSEILFYKPNSKKYSSIICRTIWNKLIKKEIMNKSIEYINNSCFRNQFLIAADDTPLNILAFQFSNNYSNINIPGYLYNIREYGMSYANKGNIKHDIILSYNYLLYFKFLYQYIIEYNKDINFFLYEFKDFYHYLYRIKDLNITEYIPLLINFCKEIQKRNIPEKLRKAISGLFNYFSK